MAGRTSDGLALCEVMGRCVSHNDVKIPRSCHRPFLLTIACPSEDIFTLVLASLAETLAFSRREARERNTESVACIPEDRVLCKGEIYPNEAPLDVGEYLHGKMNEFGVPKSKDETWGDGSFPVLVC